MSWLVANTLVAGVVALVALALGRWLRPAPAVLHGLWLFVLFKLVTPPLFSIEVDTSWWQAPRTVVLPFTVDAAGNVTAPTLVANPEGASPVSASSPWTAPLLSLWGVGSAGMCVWLAVGLVRAQRRLRGCGPVPPALAREVAQLAADLRVPVPTLCDDPSASSPYVFSFLRTRLMLPVRVLAAASAKGRAAVLVHELAHLRRRDHWLAHAELALAVALWWHPLFWFARRQLRHQAELAADAWAIATIPDATIDYATVLVQAAGAPDSTVPMSAVLAARPAAGAAFETRLTMILNENVPCRASRAWLLPFTSLALGLFAVPVQAQSEAQDPVQIEIRINGKEVEDLSGAERTALLRKLLAAEEKAGTVAPAKSKSKSKSEANGGLELELLSTTDEGEAKKSSKKGKSKDKAKGDKSSKLEPMVLRLDGLKSLEGFEALKGLDGLKGLEGLECLDDLKGLEGVKILDLSGMKEGLDEARLEILGDADLKELGITDDVVRLIDDLSAGKKLGGSIDGIVKKAMRGAMPKVEMELRADPDLAELGLTESVVKSLGGLFEDKEAGEKLGKLLQEQLGEAFEGAKFEVLNAEDLKKFSLEFDAGDLSTFQIGGEFHSDLKKVIDKALRDAGKTGDVKVHVEPIEVTVEGEPMELEILEVEPAPKKAKKADKAKKAKLDRREELR